MNEAKETVTGSDAQSHPSAVFVPENFASACFHVMSHLRLWSFAVVGLAIDLWSKHWAFSTLDANEGTLVIPNVMRFQRSLNSGALFGMGKGWTPLFIIASILALGFVFYLFAQSDRRRKTLHIGLGLVLGGALGNLYDRTFVIADVIKYQHSGRTYTVVGLLQETQIPGYIRIGAWPEREIAVHPPIREEWVVSQRQQGVVRDFIKMEPKTPWFDWWPWVFNIADSMLVVGVGLLMLNFWWDHKAERQAMAAKAEAEPLPAT